LVRGSSSPSSISSAEGVEFQMSATTRQAPSAWRRRHSTYFPLSAGAVSVASMRNRPATKPVPPSAWLSCTSNEMPGSIPSFQKSRMAVWPLIEPPSGGMTSASSA